MKFSRLDLVTAVNHGAAAMAENLAQAAEAEAQRIGGEVDGRRALIAFANVIRSLAAQKFGEHGAAS